MSRPARRATLLTLLALAVPGLAAAPVGAQSSSGPSSTATSPTTTTGPAPATTADPSATTPPPAATTPEVTAAEVGNGVLLSAEDRIELATALAEATEETGVCFGYEATLAGGGAEYGISDDQLSNAGPNVGTNEAASRSSTTCPKGLLRLSVRLIYTDESSESSDSASYSVISTVPGLSGSAARAQLEDAADLSEDGLLGDDDDLTLRNATAALPLLVDGAVPAEVSTANAAPNGDGLTGSPGSDWLRAHGLGIGIAIALLVLGVVLVVGGITGRRQSAQPKRPTDPPTPTGS